MLRGSVRPLGSPGTAGNAFGTAAALLLTDGYVVFWSGVHLLPNTNFNPINVPIWLHLNRCSLSEVMEKLETVCVSSYIIVFSYKLCLEDNGHGSGSVKLGVFLSQRLLFLSQCAQFSKLHGSCLAKLLNLCISSVTSKCLCVGQLSI